MKVGISIIIFLYTAIVIVLSANAISQPNHTIEPPHGVFEFVSETFSIRDTDKKMKTTEITETKKGRVFFEKDRFAFDLVDLSRNTDWFTKFPGNPAELGYESFSGVFEVNGSTILLRPDVMLHPFIDARPRTLEIKLSGKELILTEQMRPHTENMAFGTRVLVFRKVE